MKKSKEIKKTEAEFSRLPRIATDRCSVRVPIGYLCLWCGCYHNVVDDDTDERQQTIFDEVSR